MKAYYKDDSVTIYNGDCREVLLNIESIENGFCFSDIPYNVGKDYGVYKDNLPDDEYLAFMNCVSDLAAYSGYLIQAFYVPDKYKARLWLGLGGNFVEVILAFNQAGPFKHGFSWQTATILTNARPENAPPNLWENCKGTRSGYFFKENTYGHPGYTSLDITEKTLSRLITNEEIVLDPFAGTGTSGVVAKKLQKKAILIEINEQYCEIAARRCSQEILALEFN